MQDGLPPFLFDALPDSLFIAFFQQPFNVRFPIQYFSPKKDKRYFPVVAVFLKRAAAYFQPFRHLFVGHVPFPI